jgi:hypothetical protein
MYLTITPASVDRQSNGAKNFAGVPRPMAQWQDAGSSDSREYEPFYSAMQHENQKKAEQRVKNLSLCA